MLHTLLRHEAIWRARDLTCTSRLIPAARLSTGFDVLDELLYDHGWPRGGLTEIICGRHGIGELRLLAHGLAQLIQDTSAWIVWMNPPFVPYAPALQAIGIDVNRILLIYPQTHKEALWALEEALDSSSCCAALAWLDEQQLTAKQVRRIQVQAKEGPVWTTLFRPLHAARRSSAAELRLQIQTDTTTDNRLNLTVLKRRGGWEVRDIQLPLAWHPQVQTQVHTPQPLAAWYPVHAQVA